MSFQKKLIIPIIFIIALISYQDIQAYNNHQTQSRHAHGISCAPEYREALKRLRQVDEVQSLINKILSEGCIKIISHSDNCAGLWNGGDRVIAINPSLCRTLGERISTILMELNNASTNVELMRITDTAAAGKLTIDQYVEQIERMEHKNGLNTCRLLEKGHQMGIFPNDYCWKVYENFDDYYMLQQVLDHSLWIADNYRFINARGNQQQYKGTVPNLHRLSNQDRDDICLYLEVKNDLGNTDRRIREMAQKRLSQELHALRSGGSKSWNASNRLKKKSRLVEQIFKIQV
jgi:hypothetical protein